MVFRLEAWFSGHVQGVGFRYQTVQVAKGFYVCGFVKNLADGRVYLLVEGEEDEARSFLDAVNDELSSYIRDVEVQETSGEATCKTFEIAY